ncbi:MAG: hypothetical protein ABI432_16045 [Flavobacteriales bacterium]
MPFQRWCLLLAALVYLTAAWFGVGYSSEDEQRHVIEFAEALRGNIPQEVLAVEYPMRIRSMVQPALCAGVFEACDAIGISDPFNRTLVLRLLTAALALWIIQGFVRALVPTLPDKLARPFILLSYFLWFIPVLNIRFAGEAWSGLLFLRGLSLIITERSKQYLIPGLWFGAAILFRPAVVMLPFGVVLWLVFMQRAAWINVLTLLAGGLLVLSLGSLIDSIAYGEPVFTLWNYTRAGVLGEEAWRFTSLPWYHYFLFIFKYTVPPIALALLGALGLLIALRPRHVLVWVIVPFLIAHSLLPVKEIRFLFPLALLMPWLLISAWDAASERWPGIARRRALTGIGIAALAVVNLVALLVAISTPAGNGRIRLAQVAHERFGATPVHIACEGDWHMWIPPFYLAQGSTSEYVEAEASFSAEAADDERPKLLITQGDDYADPCILAISYPRWTLPFMRLYGLEDGFEPLVLRQTNLPQ